MPSDDAQTSRSGPTDFARRTFIKGVIAGGVAVSSAAYLFRNSPLLTGGAARMSGVKRLLTLNVNGQTRRVGRSPAGDPGHDAPIQARAHRHQTRLRPGGVRCLHGACR